MRKYVIEQDPQICQLPLAPTNGKQCLTRSGVRLLRTLMKGSQKPRRSIMLKTTTITGLANQAAKKRCVCSSHARISNATAFAPRLLGMLRSRWSGSCFICACLHAACSRNLRWAAAVACMTLYMPDLLGRICFDLHPVTTAGLPKVLCLSLGSDRLGNMFVAFVLHLADNHS